MNIRSNLLLIMLIGLSLVGLNAQQFDNPSTANVVIYSQADLASGTSHRIQFNLSGVKTLNFPSVANASNKFSTNFSSVSLALEKSYTVSGISATALNDFTMNIDCPSLFRVFINGEKRREISKADLGAATSFTLLIKGASAAYLAPGTATSLGLGKVQWEVGLGKLPNGKSAGRLLLTAPTLLSLRYDSRDIRYIPVDDSGIVVNTLTSIPGKIQAVLTPSIGVVLSDLNNEDGFLINFYQRNQLSEYNIFPDMLYYPTNLNTLPFVSYKVKKISNSELRVYREIGNKAYYSRLVYSSGEWTTYDWQRVGGTQTDRKTTIKLQSGNSSIYEIKKKLGSTIHEYTKKTNVSVPGGIELGSVKKGNLSTSNTTTYSYYDQLGADAYGRLGKVKKIALLNGSGSEVSSTTFDYYTTYEYSGFPSKIGQIKNKNKTYLDGGNTNYTSFDYEDDPFSGKFPLINEIVEYTIGIKTGYSTFDYVGINSGGEQILQTVSKVFHKTGTSSSSYLQSKTKRFWTETEGAFLQDKLHSREHSGDQKEVYLYFQGNWNPSNQTFSTGSGYYRILKISGNSDSEGGGVLESNLLSASGGSLLFPMESVYLHNRKSTISESIVSKSGVTIASRAGVYVESGNFEYFDWTLYYYNNFNQLTSEKVAFSGGSLISNQISYSGGLMTSQTSIDGVRTTYSYDSNGLQSSITKSASSNPTPYSSQPSERISFTHNSAGKVLVTTYGAGTNSYTVSNAYDLAGRIVSSSHSDLGTTSYSYSSLNPHDVTISYPNGTTSVQAFYKDGRKKKVSGTANPVVSYSYGVGGASNPSGSKWAKATFEEPSPDAWTTTVVDWIGREVKTAKPSWGTQGDVVASNVYQSSTGRLLSQSIKAGTEDLAPKELYEYYGWGELRYVSSDLNGNGSRNNTLDRVTEYKTELKKESNVWWLYEYENIYHDEGGAGVATSEVKTRVQIESKNWISETHFKDAYQKTTIEKVYIDPSNELLKIYTNYPDSTQDEIVDILNGNQVGITDSSGVFYRTKYDGLGRIVEEIDPRIGSTVYTYKIASSLLDKVTAPDGETITYGYNNRGDLVSETNALGKKTRYQTDAVNRWEYVWGEVPNPIKIKYDKFGRAIEHHTYRSGSAWASSSKPSAFSSSGDKTQWLYDGETGLLKEETNAAGKKHKFEYNELGQVTKRTDARNVITNYLYFDQAYKSSGQFSGDIRKVDYTDGVTTDLEYTYNRNGQLTQVKDYTGTRTFQYNNKLQFLRESMGSYLLSNKLEYTYDSFGRVQNTKLKMGSMNATLFDQYGYDTKGRFNKLTTKSGEVFNYKYLANSHFVGKIENGPDTSKYWSSITYEENSNRIRTVGSFYGNSWRPIVYHDYDVLGRVTAKTLFGPHTESYGEDNYLSEHYTYNERNEVVTAVSKTPNGPNGTAVTALPGRNYTWAYDNAGNRTSSALNGHSTSYTSTNLNRYSMRTNPEYISVEGASDSSTVKVNGQTADRLGDYYQKMVRVANGNYSIYAGINVDDDTTVEHRDTFKPRTNQHQVYDDNGNLTSDWNYTYAWDSENRMRYMVTRSSSLGEGRPHTWVHFSYDYLGRRVKKTLHHATASAKGISGQYYNTPDFLSFKGLSPTTGGINYTWNFGSPSPPSGMANNNFSVRWNGQLTATMGSGNYYFQASVNNGVRVWIDGELIIDRWTSSWGAITSTVAVPLVSGETVSIVMEVYETSGASDADLRWRNGSSGSFSYIPNTSFTRSPTSYTDPHSWTTVEETRYVYDGWNLIAEFEPSFSGTIPKKTYSWGLDTAGELGGSVGNGGVLLFTDNVLNEEFYPTYDIQGSVLGLVASAASSSQAAAAGYESHVAGEFVAAYEYNVYGEQIRSTGSRADRYHLGYSNKYTDKETGLVYFGFRYYDPKMGRFIGTDPIGLAGGSNLYNFTGNSPSNGIDVLGLYPTDYSYYSPAYGNTSGGSWASGGNSNWGIGVGYSDTGGGFSDLSLANAQYANSIGNQVVVPWDFVGPLASNQIRGAAPERTRLNNPFGSSSSSATDPALDPPGGISKVNDFGNNAADQYYDIGSGVVSYGKDFAYATLETFALGFAGQENYLSFETKSVAMVSGMWNDAVRFGNGFNRFLGGAPYGDFSGLGEMGNVLVGYQEGDSGGKIFSNASLLLLGPARYLKGAKRLRFAANRLPGLSKIDNFIDLTKHRKSHILNRHRAGSGKIGRTEFPSKWSDNRILHNVSDIATDPNATRGIGKWNSPYAIGTRDGVQIRVDFYPSNHPKYSGQISTAYPIGVTPNP